MYKNRGIHVYKRRIFIQAEGGEKDGEREKGREEGGGRDRASEREGGAGRGGAGGGLRVRASDRT